MTRPPENPAFIACCVSNSSCKISQCVLYSAYNMDEIASGFDKGRPKIRRSDTLGAEPSISPYYRFNHVLSFNETNSLKFIHWNHYNSTNISDKEFEKETVIGIVPQAKNAQITSSTVLNWKTPSIVFHIILNSDKDILLHTQLCVRVWKYIIGMLITYLLTIFWI